MHKCLNFIPSTVKLKISESLAKKSMRYNLRSLARMDVEVAPVEQSTPKRKRERPIRKNLMILNDNCLLEIFSYLKSVDLANVVFVNKRSNALTEKHFLKYGLQFTPKFDFAQN